MVDAVTLASICCVVIVIFFILVTFVLKLEGNGNIYRKRNSLRCKDRKKMVSVSPVKLPFSINIQQPQQEKGKLTGTNGGSISLLLEGEKKCIISYFVFVNIRELQKAVEDKKYTSERKFVDILNLISLWSSKPENICFPENGSCFHEFSYHSLPLEVKDKLLEVMRDSTSQEYYTPLLMRIELDEQERLSLVSDNDVVSIITAISASPCGGGFKYQMTEQYMEIVDGRVFLLKKLYNSCLNESTESTHEELSEDIDLCVICHENPVTRALLPCRHLCTCKICFSKLELCPVCRQSIASFFIVKDESDLPDVTEENNEDNDDISSLIQNEGIWNFIKSIWNAS